MKTKFVIYSIFFLLTSNGWAQKVDYSKIILPESSQDIEFEEKLVQLAWKNHPSNQVLTNNLAAARYETRIAAAEWLNMIQLTGNLNEFNIDKGSDAFNRSQFFPRYNIGANIRLGIFASVPNQVKRNREFEQIANHDINSKKLEVRAEVLKLYNEYLMYREIFNLRSQEVEESAASFTLIEQRFKNGEEQYDRYVQALSAINRSKIDRILAQTNFLNSKLALEELIGIRLEDVK